MNSRVGLAKKVTLSFHLQNILIPEDQETTALFASRTHLFLDRGYKCIILELHDIRPWEENKNYQPWRWDWNMDETDGPTLYVERWTAWDHPYIPSSEEVLAAAKYLLQKHKRKLGWEGFHQWLARMTPDGWEIPPDLIVA